MSEGTGANGRRRGRVHPLFAELYLNADPDDGQQEEKRRAPRRKQARTRQVARPSKNG